MPLLEQIQKDIASLPEDAQQMVIYFVLFLKQHYQTRQTQSTKPFSLDNQPFVGMWQNRPEMQDSTAWVRQIRKQQWRR
ncbi:MAG: DUF2281 domain-containing protein [Symploca sp. SIO2C1]|nr:DUF2281 domain-containing protein [Symploca sp. SIO2C1]